MHKQLKFPVQRLLVTCQSLDSDDSELAKISLNITLPSMPEGPEGITVEHIVSQAKGAHYDPEDVDAPECKCFLFPASFEEM